MQILPRRRSLLGPLDGRVALALWPGLLDALTALSSASVSAMQFTSYRYMRVSLHDTTLSIYACTHPPYRDVIG